MGTNASTHQDITGVTSSTVPSQSIPSAGLSSPRSQYSSSYPLENINSPTPSHQGAVSSPDGYKWRKYGQKSVKGSDHPRSYYKCTYPGCAVKKYTEKYEEDGKVLERVMYKGGEHTHDPSRFTRVNATDQNSFKQSVLSENSLSDLIVKTEPSLPPSLDISDPVSLASQAKAEVLFPTSPRLVVETSADVDHNDDGYSWRKYGQKNVKGGSFPIPKGYYRCTQEDCPVKKQVEQRGNIIYNMYEGTHNHAAPGWEDATKKKKRKLNRSTERFLKTDETNESMERQLDENEVISNKSYSSNPEESISLVMGESHPHHSNERPLIPLQELQAESNVLSSHHPHHSTERPLIPLQELQGESNVLSAHPHHLPTERSLIQLQDLQGESNVHHHHHHSAERSLIPLQELQTESNVLPSIDPTKNELPNM